MANMAPDYRAALASLAAEMEGEAEERDDCCYEVLRSFAGRARALLAQEPAPETDEVEREALEAARDALLSVRAIGQRYRDDWSGFDGRSLRNEINGDTEHALSIVSSALLPRSPATVEREEGRRLLGPVYAVPDGMEHDPSVPCPVGVEGASPYECWEKAGQFQSCGDCPEWQAAARRALADFARWDREYEESIARARARPQGDSDGGETRRCSVRSWCSLPDGHAGPHCETCRGPVCAPSPLSKENRR